MSGRGYKVGNFIGQNTGKLCLFFTAAAVCYGFYENLNDPRRAARVSAAAPPSVPASAAKPDPCLTGQDERHQQATQLLKEKKFDAAANVLWPCLSSLSENGKKLHDKAAALAQKENDRIADAMNKKIKAEKKRQGVRIGMSEQDVLDSSWGRPEKVNRTTTQRGVREQWVYHGNYLYFEDGVLTTIQN